MTDLIACRIKGETWVSLERLKLIPYETITGFILALSGIIWCMIVA